MWLPIPKLVTAYHRWRDMPILQLMGGTVRLMVTLLVKAAELGVALDVQTLEEFCQSSVICRRDSLHGVYPWCAENRVIRRVGLDDQEFDDSWDPFRCHIEANGAK